MLDVNYFKIDDASLPTEVLPDMPPEILNMLLSSDSMPYLKLTQKPRNTEYHLKH